MSTTDGYGTYWGTSAADSTDYTITATSGTATTIDTTWSSSAGSNWVRVDSSNNYDLMSLPSYSQSELDAKLEEQKNAYEEKLKALERKLKKYEEDPLKDLKRETKRFRLKLLKAA